MLRKTLKQENKITAGYIRYPATLMAKMTGEKNYTKVRDFLSVTFYFVFVVLSYLKFKP